MYIGIVYVNKEYMEDDYKSSNEETNGYFFGRAKNKR